MYTRVNWTNSATTPLNQQNLNVMDKGIKDNATSIKNIEIKLGLNTWDGTAAEGLKGTGTESDPYIIGTPGELVYFSAAVNGNKNGFLSGAYTKLTADIDLQGMGFIPIGTHNNPYQGVFDGCGFCIRGLKITDVNAVDVGLFSYTRNSEIKNLSVIAFIACDTGAAIVSNATDTRIHRCMSGGTVTCDSAGAGIVNNITRGSVESSVNKCAVTSVHQSVGGIVHKASGAVIRECCNLGITHCYSGAAGITEIASMAGSEAGYDKTIIKNCYNAGRELEDTVGTYTNPICSALVDDSVCENTYYIPTLYTFDYVCGTESTTMKTEEFVNTLNAEKQEFTYNETINNGYPCLLWQTGGV